MGKELLLVAEALSNEKGVPKEVVFNAIQAALESATRKFHGIDMGVRVHLDGRTGESETFRYWDVVEDDALENPDAQIGVTAAKERSPGLEVGDRIEEPLVSIDFGRISAQTARQVIFQKIREAERDQIIEQYKPRIGQLVTGTVKKVMRDNLLVDLGGKAEALLPRQDMLPNEMFRLNDRVRAYLSGVSTQPKGPQLIVSRTRNEMIIELFKIEVPEVGESIIQIKAAARDPGHRAKIAVKTNDGRIDPVGACVGMRGARVQAVSNELGGERVDIILWDENPAQFVINAMAPADISSIVVDEESHTMDLAVQKEQLSQAIGRNGQNVRLASQMTGWTLNVMTVEEFNNKNQEESARTKDVFVEALGLDEDIANILVMNGFSSIEEIAYVPKEELLSITEFDEDLIDALRDRANDALLTQALTSNAEIEVDLSSSLESLMGMTADVAEKLQAQGIVTIEDLAEQSIDDLLELTDLTAEKAGELIMKAREPWFKENN